MTSWIAAKSSCWPTPWILNLRYSPFFGRPASNQTSEPTVSRPWLWRDVDADEAARHGAQAEVAAEGVDRILGPLLGLERLDPQALEQVARVLVGQLEPAVRGAPLRHGPVGVGQQLAERVPVGGREREHHPARPGLDRARSSAPGTRSAPRRPAPPRRPRGTGAPGPPPGRRAPGSARRPRRRRPGRSRSRRRRRCR